MTAPSSRRIYSGQALERWFCQLNCDWERAFAPSVLSSGRRLYRAGAIRAIELTLDDAIVHGRVAGADGYAVLAWANGRPAVRGSTADHGQNQTLAVAGLYEIEELISEEVFPCALPEALPAQQAPVEATDQSRAEPPPTPARAPARPLAISFRWREDEVAFRADWVEGNRRQPVFGPHAATANAAERELVIGLTSGSRRAGFWPDGQGRFKLADLAKLPRFLKHTLPLWRKRFRVETPPGWERLEREPTALVVEAQAEAVDGTAFSLHWRLGKAVLDLSSEEIPALLRRGGGLRLTRSGRLVEVPTETADEFNAWRELQNGDRVLPRYLIFSLFERENLRTRLAPQLRQWRESADHPASPVSLGVPSFLRDYQKAGVRWLSGLAAMGCHGLLADEMGLGKTLQVLTLLRYDAVSDQPNLIICPASVVPVWEAEAARFYPELRVQVLGKGAEVGASEACLWLASYTQVRRQKAELEKVDFGYLVLDEAQFIKNPDAKTTQACLSLRAQRRIALTGTPLENRPLDLWTLFRFLMPGLLGTRRRFEQLWTSRPTEAHERLKAQIGPFILRRTKAAVLSELPDKVEYELTCPMTDLQQSEYRRLAEEGLEAMGTTWRDAASRMPLVALLTRLRQACCDPGLLPWQDCRPEQSGKLTMLADRLTETTESGHKVVVFSQFTGLIERARQIVGERNPTLPWFELTGKTRNRAAPVNGFQRSEGAAVIYVSLKAGGTGITLHAADYVFLLDPWWNPAVERQAIDRVHRLGQRNAVFVYRMITPGTVESRIEALKQRKQALAEDLLNETSLPPLTDWFASLDDLIAPAASG